MSRKIFLLKNSELPFQRKFCIKYKKILNKLRDHRNENITVYKTFEKDIVREDDRDSKLFLHFPAKSPKYKSLSDKPKKDSFSNEKSWRNSLQKHSSGSRHFESLEQLLTRTTEPSQSVAPSFSRRRCHKWVRKTWRGGLIPHRNGAVQILQRIVGTRLFVLMNCQVSLKILRELLQKWYGAKIHSVMSWCLLIAAYFAELCM